MTTQPAASSAAQPVIVNVAHGGPALPPRSTGIAYLWLIFLGGVGAHQFYIGKPGRGILYLFTLGLLGFGVLIDLFTLPSQVRTRNAQRAVGIA